MSNTITVGISEHYDDQNRYMGRDYAIKTDISIPDDLNMAQRQEHLEAELQMIKTAIQNNLRAPTQVIETKAIEADSKPSVPSRFSKSKQANSRKASGTVLATEKQLSFLGSLAKANSISEQELARMANIDDLSTLTVKQCSNLIQTLNDT